MASAKTDFVSSVGSVRAIAIFFDDVTHKLTPSDWRQGADIVKLAGKRGLRIPAALDGYTIKYNAKPHSPTAADLARTIVVELPPRTPRTAAAKTISGCFDVGKGPIKGKVCVSCSISWTKITCKITITISVGF